MKFWKILLCSAVVLLGLVFLSQYSGIRPVREVFTFTVIDAPKPQVWRVLTDFGAYPQWNPFYTDIDGPCLPGSRLHIHVKLSEHTLSYSPRVLTVTPPDELAWKEQLLFKGLFYGEHHFSLETTEGGQTRLVQHDRYSGALVPLLTRMYQPQIENGFRRMNNALKKRAEQQGALAAQH